MNSLQYSEEGLRFSCNSGKPAIFEGGGFENVVGVIGAQTSSVSIVVANLLKLYQVNDYELHLTNFLNQLCNFFTAIH